MEENKNIETLSNEDNENKTCEYADTDGSISVTLCNGVTYLLDAEAFDWSNLSENKAPVISNEETLVRMVHDIISMDMTDDDDKALLKEIIKSTDEFGASLKIDFDYSSFNLSDKELALTKCFDALTVIRTILCEIKVYDAGFAAVKALFASFNGVEHHCHNDSEPEEYGCHNCCCDDVNTEEEDEHTDVYSYSMPNIPKEELDDMFSSLNGFGDIPHLSEADLSDIFTDIESSIDEAPTEEDDK